MHLYAAFLGGELAEDRMGEDHEVVFVVAQDTTSARKAAQKKWGGTGRAHVDAVTRLEMIDGYTVALERTGAGDVTEMEGYNYGTGARASPLPGGPKLRGPRRRGKGPRRD